MGEFFPDLNTSVPSYGGDHRHVNVGGTTYISSYAPSSTMHVPSNAFLMTHPPHVPHGPSRHSVASNRVVLSSASVFASGGYIPPYMSRGKPFHQSYYYGYTVPHSQGIPNYHILMHLFLGHAGGFYYPTRKGHGLYHNQPYMNQPF